MMEGESLDEVADALGMDPESKLFPEFCGLRVLLDVLEGFVLEDVEGLNQSLDRLLIL